METWYNHAEGFTNYENNFCSHAEGYISQQQINLSSGVITEYKGHPVYYRPDANEALYPHDMIYDYFEPLYEEILRR